MEKVICAFLFICASMFLCSFYKPESQIKRYKNKKSRIPGSLDKGILSVSSWHSCCPALSAGPALPLHELSASITCSYGWPPTPHLHSFPLALSCTLPAPPCRSRDSWRNPFIWFVLRSVAKFSRIDLWVIFLPVWVLNNEALMDSR